MSGDSQDLGLWLSEVLRAEEERLVHAVQAQAVEHRRALLAAVSAKIEAGQRAHEANDAAGGRPNDFTAQNGSEPECSHKSYAPRAGSELERLRDEAEPETEFKQQAAVNLSGSEPEQLPRIGVSDAKPLKRLSSVIRRLKDQPRTSTESLFHLSLHEPLHLPDSVSSSLHLLKQNSKARVVHSMSHTTKDGDSQPGCFSRFVRSNLFEYLSCLAIVACLVVMILEVEYDGANSGYMLELAGYDRRASSLHGERLYITNEVLTALFFVEFTARLAEYRLTCWRNPWMWFDFFCLMLSLLDSIGSSFFKSMVEPTFLRVARFARVVRMLKALRAMNSLQTLYLLVRSLQASMGALFWSFVLLWCTQVVTGVLLSKLLRSFVDNEDNDAIVRLQVFDYFGTFMNSTLTMFEITLANWVVPVRLLYSKVGWGYGAFFILYRGCFMFAVIRVITAVFLAETARCASNDDALNMQKKQRQKDVYCRKLGAVFQELDTSQDGYLSREELMPLICDKILKTWLSTLEIDTHDIDHLVNIMDSAGGELIDIEAFTSGMARIKGPARSMDLLQVQYKTAEIGRKLDSLISDVHAVATFRAEASAVASAATSARAITEVSVGNSAGESAGASHGGHSGVNATPPESTGSLHESI